jgi:hypothetical protein
VRIEVDATWLHPKRWDESARDLVVERLEYVRDLLGSKVIPFLISQSGEDENE